MVTAAAALLSLQLPPDAERLVASQELAQGTLAMWDLIHDRTHSPSDLPFDPFAGDWALGTASERAPGTSQRPGARWGEDGEQGET